jgi:hypothetical protein
LIISDNQAETCLIITINGTSDIAGHSRC